MSDSDALREILRLSRLSAQWQQDSLKIEFLRFWQDELSKPRNADPRRLLQHGFKLYSQNDEDGIIQEIFRRIGMRNRRFIEFGVQGGLQCNTVKLLIEGWRGLWIEANPNSVAQIRKHFDSYISQGQLGVLGSMVTAENVNTLFSTAGFTGEIDVLSIDIDFNDYWVWKAIEIVLPRVVVIEYNASLRPPLSLTVPYDPTHVWAGGNYFGASLEALVRVGRAKGYRIVGCGFAGVNAFFVRDDICGDLFLEPATAEEHYEPARYFSSIMPSGHSGRPGPYVNV